MEGPDEAAWHAQLAVEHANVRIALGWLLDHQEAETALAMATGVRPHWEFRYHYAEGIAWLERALAAAGPAPTRVRGWGLRSLSNLVFVNGDARRAVALYEEALAIFRTRGGRRGSQYRPRLPRHRAHRTGRVDGGAAPRRRRAWQSRGGSATQRGEAYALRGIGFAASVAGDLPAAAAAHEAALAVVPPAR